MNKKIKTLLIGLLILIVILVIFLPKLISGDDNRTIQNPGRASMEFPVSAHIVTYEKLSNNVYTTGSILANEEVEIRSEVSGKIVKILFNEGGYVKKGDLLVKINDTDLQAQLRKAESKVKLVEDREARQKHRHHAPLGDRGAVRR